MNPEIIVVLMSVIIVIAIPIIIIATAIKKAKSDRMFKAAIEALTNARGFQQFDDRPRSLTSNCPNCGAPISDSSLKACPFCNSLLVNPLGGEWKFADIEEG